MPGPDYAPILAAIYRPSMTLKIIFDMTAALVEYLYIAYDQIGCDSRSRPCRLEIPTMNTESRHTRDFHGHNGNNWMTAPAA